jgi:hypothetical protein
MIKSLYNEYFQKSRIFLYPALNIPRGGSVTPIETYVSWSGYYKQEDKKLIAVYHLRSDKEFIEFEKNKLFKNSMFSDFYETDDSKGVYVFDYEPFTEDWTLFTEGKYSKLSKTVKDRILSYYANSKKNYVYVDSYINPHLYYDLYSRLLECDKQLLEDVGELCDRPDIERETLTATVKTFEISGFTITSP